jgi:hypothetical protein
MRIYPTRADSQPRIARGQHAQSVLMRLRGLDPSRCVCIDDPTVTCPSSRFGFYDNDLQLKQKYNRGELRVSSASTKCCALRLRVPSCTIISHARGHSKIRRTHRLE